MSVAKALIKQYPEMNLNHINLYESSWAQNLFRRMKFVRRFTTTGKVPIPEALHKELEKAYLHSIVRKTEENDIPPSSVLNLDQASPNTLQSLTRQCQQKDQKMYQLRPYLPLPLIDIFCPCTLSMQVE